MADAAGGGDNLESSPENLYFLAIEKVFIEQRGAPLYLSPKDWRVALQWYQDEIPLEWVERTLCEIFEKRRAKGTVDKVVSLGYCKRSVQAAWKRHQKMQAPAVEAEPAIDVAARLEALARRLPPGLPERDSWAARLTALEGDPERIEDQLQQLDSEILEAALADLGPAQRSEVESELERSLANLARRLPAGELESVRGQVRERLVRERLGLVLLSLFTPEAVP